MNSGPLPPVPDLIPISCLRKRASSNNNSDGGPSECAPCASNCSEVMGEQRPRRRSANQPAVELIDTTGSRGLSAAPQAPLSRKARPEHHRKSDRRRREHRKLANTRSNSKHSKSREKNTPFPQNPRVNPIFVWVRQEDTRIVEVKCEDYDKRNRIVLTKTAQGWRAIPRTETLVPTLKKVDKDQHHHHHHHHHKNKRSRKSKVRRKSTGVQVSSDIEQDEEDTHQEEHKDQEQQSDKTFEEKQTGSSPSWMSTDNVNIESLLPSHTIKIKRSTSPNHSPEQNSNVNSAVSDCAQTPPVKCSADKICDVSPLDNLLAVAELEFKQQIQSEEWNKSEINPNDDPMITYIDHTDDDKEFMKSLETLNDLIDSEKSKLEFTKDLDLEEEPKTEECDYNEDDDNNLAMDDILSRLEQSLRSPDSGEINNCDTSTNNNNNNNNKSEEETKIQYDSDNETDLKSVPEFEEEYFEVETDINKPEDQKIDETNPEIINLVESSTNDEDDLENDAPTDLSIKPITEEIPIMEEPTDLSVPKPVSPRPPSQNSEAIQSPQPSGIPAVPPSPDTVSTTVTTVSTVSSKPKSIFLESLLTNCTKKLALNSEVTITPQREPLDLGKCRKSASPTVTCSEEINSCLLTQSEPPTKKIKSVDITLKHLLDVESSQKNNTDNNNKNSTEKVNETPKLLELLQTETEIDPLVQLKQLIADPAHDIPDPLLVPKERFSQILINPGTEIPKLLKERPELRLPQALAFPHIMQDPNMLVINTHHLESILTNKNTLNESTKSKHDPKEKNTDKPSTDTSSGAKKKTDKIESNSKAFDELANDINTATQTAMNQMSWFPYINHIEAMAMAGNQDLIKMLNSVHLPLYMNQLPELFSSVRPTVPPMNFPMNLPVNYTNNLEFGMWQEAMVQAQLLRNKSLENFNNEQNIIKSYFDKVNAQQSNRVTLNNRMNPRMQTSNKQAGHSTQYFRNDHNTFQSTNPYANYNPFTTKTSTQNVGHHHHMKVNHNKPFMTSKSTSSTYSQHQQQLQRQQQQQQQLQQQQQQQLQQQQQQQQQHQQQQQNIMHLYSQMSDKEKRQYTNLNLPTQDQMQQNFQNFIHKDTTPKQKLSNKPFANPILPQKTLPHQDHLKERIHPSGNDSTKLQTTQPIDLSGSTASGGKLKVKQHLIDPANTPRLLKQHDDVPEVGSTTASIEEMQDAHKHLWHPLFGNEKGYTSPWNWTTVTAAGE